MAVCLSHWLLFSLRHTKHSLRRGYPVAVQQTRGFANSSRRREEEIEREREREREKLRMYLLVKIERE